MDIQYLEISQFNGLDEDILINMQCDRIVPVMTNEGADYYLCVDRFDVSNSAIPIYIPFMQRETKSANYKPSYTINRIEQTENNISSTDQSIALQFVSKMMSSDEYVEFVSMVPVDYTPESVQSIFPNLGTVTRGDTIANKFFHVFNSLHYIQMINNSITKCYKQLVDMITNYEGISGNNLNFPPLLIDQPFIITKSDAGYTLQIHKNMLPQYDPLGVLLCDFNLYFNNKLSSCFGFHAVQSKILGSTWDEIIIPSSDLMNSTGDYYYFGEVRTTPDNQIFPFNKLVFTTSTIPVCEMNIATNTDTIRTAQDMRSTVITDFCLRVSDVDKFYNMCYYNCNTYNRKIMLKSSSNMRFNVMVTAVTPDGYEFKVPLKSKCYANILLAFFTAQ